MTIAFRSFSTFDNSTGALSSVPVDKPAGTASGDVLIAFCMYYGQDAGPTPPSGWTEIDYASEVTPKTNSGHRLHAWYRVAGGSEPSTYTWSMVNTDLYSAFAIVCYSGVNTSSPIDGTPSFQFNGTSASMSAASITTTVANAMLVFLGCAGDSAAFSATPPSSFTERVDFYADWRSLYAAEKIQPSAGATGSQIATINTSRINWGALVALKPAPAASMLALLGAG